MAQRKMINNRAIRIVEAATEEFARSGFHAARVDRIARRAGVNKQLLFYYYHSKRGLFQAVLAREAADLERAIAARAPAAGSRRPLIERLRATLESHFDFLAANPDLVSLHTQAGRSDTRPFAPAINRVVVLLAEGQGLGDVRDDLDPHLAAAQALLLMVGYLVLEPLIAASAPVLGIDEQALAERWKESAVRLLMEGLLTAPPA